MILNSLSKALRFRALDSLASWLFRPNIVVALTLFSAAVLGYLASDFSRSMVVMLAALPVLLFFSMVINKVDTGYFLPGLIGLVALVPFQIGTGTGSSINLAILGVGAYFGFWVAGNAIQHKSIRALRAPANLPWALLLLVAAFSVVSGAALWNPWVETKSNFLVVQMAQWGVFALSGASYFLAANTLKSRKHVQWLVWTIVGFGGLFLFTQLVGRGGSYLFLSSTIFRISVMGLAGGLAIHQASLSNIRRLGLAILSLGFLAIPILRGNGWASGWVPGLVTLSFLVLLEVWRRYRWSGLPGYALLVFGGFFAVFSKIAGTESWSLDTRIIAWRGLVELLDGRWLLGLGLASYWHYWKGVFGSMSYLDPATGFHHVTFDPQVNFHNNYADILGQMGIVGLIVVLGLLATIILHSYKRWAVSEPGFDRAFAAATTSIAVGMAFSGLLGDWFFPFVYNVGLNGFRDSFLGWMLLGAVVAMESISEQENEQAGNDELTAAGQSLPRAAYEFSDR